jgi:integrase
VEEFGTGSETTNEMEGAKMTTGFESNVRGERSGRKHSRRHGTGSVWTRETLANWYFSFYRDGRQHFVNTKIPKTEENKPAAEAMLERALAERTLDIPTDAIGVNKLRYDHLRQNLIDHFKLQKKASVYQDKKGKDQIMGAKWLDLYFTGKTLGWMADHISRYPAFVQGLPEVKASVEERFRKEVLLKMHVVKMPRKSAEAEGRQVADRARDASINRSLSTLRSMYGRYAEANPKKLSPKDIPFMPRIQGADNIGQGFVDVDGYQKIYDAMPEKLRPLVQFLYITGFRSGAAKQITWNMIEWRKVGGKEVAAELRIPVGFMKNKEPWSVPLVGPLAPIADTLGHGFRHIDMPIFVTTNFRREWNKVCGNLGLGIFDKKSQKYHGLHPHDFRRAASRNLIRAGVSQAVAQKITGHKSSRMFERYNISSSSDVADALVKVGNYNAQQSEQQAGKG